VPRLAALEGVSAREHRVGPLEERLERGDVPVERVGESHDHAEERADVDRVHECFVGDARRAYGVRVGACDFIRVERQLLEEAERRREAS
jgi:hypothetical protein